MDAMNAAGLGSGANEEAEMVASKLLGFLIKAFIDKVIKLLNYVILYFVLALTCTVIH
jgi:hypothetical protein